MKDNNTMQTLRDKERKEEARKRRMLNLQLPVNCLHCNMLEIIDLDKQKVRCSYMITNKCLIEKEGN